MEENVFDGDASHYADGDGMLDLSQEQRAFVEEVAYYANQEYTRRKEAGEDWVLPSVAIAQACNESGYGSVTDVNIFGIKGEGTVVGTSEYGDGGYYNIQDSFVSHGTIEQDVKEYYDLICGTGGYEGWDNYAAARNLDDPEATIAAIHAAGYATSPTYTEDVSSIINQYHLQQFDTGAIDFEYDQVGYQEGSEAYDASMKIVSEMETISKKAEKSIMSACSSKPKVDYQSIIQFQTINTIIQTIKELLEKTKMIADEEKYLAEQYNDDGGASKDSFQLASMAAYMKNFAFDDMNEFQQMVSNYQKTDSKGTFSSWFQSYVSSNGIESRVVNMVQYQKAIKDSGAVLSSDYVVSKVTFLLDDGDSKKDDSDSKDSQDKGKNTNNSDRNDSNYFHSSEERYSPYTGGVVSSGVVTSSVENDSSSQKTLASNKTDKENDSALKEVHEVTNKTTEVKDTDATKVLDNTTVASENPTEHSTPLDVNAVVPVTANPVSSNPPQSVSSNTVYSPSNEGVVYTPQTTQTEPIPSDNTTNIETDPSKDISSDNTLTPTESNSTTGNNHSSVTKIPTISNTTDTTSSRRTTNGSAAVPVILGLGAAGAAAGGAAYYYHKKKQDDNYEEYDEEEEDDYQDDDFVADTYEEDDNTEEKAIPELNEINEGEI